MHEYAVYPSACELFPNEKEKSVRFVCATEEVPVPFPSSWLC